METNTETTAIAVVEPEEHRFPVKRSLFDLEPEDQVLKATQIANALYKVIEKQKLFTVIQGKKYVRVEAWELLGTFLGILPRERSIQRLEDGSYEASVDLIRATDGVVVGGASAICGVDEKRWANAEQYARRSMAFTRAVGKAYRSSFSWIVSLAGYQPTPAEEMPTDEPKVVVGKPEGKQVRPYTGDTQQQEAIQKILLEKKIPEDRWALIHERMMGKYGKDLPTVIAEVNQ